MKTAAQNSFCCPNDTSEPTFVISSSYLMAIYLVHPQESTTLWENVPYFKLHQYSPTYLRNGCEDKGKINFKEWEMLYIYWLPYVH